MQDEPEVFCTDNHLPGLPCYCGHPASAQSPNAPLLDADGELVRCTPQTFGQVLGTCLIAVEVGTVFVLLAMVVVTAVRACADGYGRLIFYLGVSHLPWVALALRARRRSRAVGRHAPSVSNLPTRLEAPLNLWVSPRQGRVCSEGLFWQGKRESTWQEFTGFTFLGEQRGYFAVRLCRREPRKPDLPPPTFNARIRRLKAFCVEAFGLSSRTIAFTLIFLTPPLLTLCLAVSAWHLFGWRADVQCAGFLTGIYGLIASVPLQLLAGLVLHLLVEPLLTATCVASPDAEAEAARQVYLIFDSREVTAQDVLQCLDHCLDR